MSSKLAAYQWAIDRDPLGLSPEVKRERSKSLILPYLSDLNKLHYPIFSDE